MKRSLSLLLIAVCATVVCAKQPNFSYNYQRGVEAINNDNYEEGESYLLAELDDNPKNGYAYAWLAVVEEDKDELGSAINMLNKALQYIPKKDKYYIAWSYSSLARIYCKLEDHTTCIRYITLAVKTEPTNSSWLQYRSIIYREMGNYALAIADAQQIIKLLPGSTTGYLLAAHAHHHLGEYEQALSLYQYANSLAERSFTYAYMAQSEYQLQRYEDAADHIVQALKLEHYEQTATDFLSDANPELLEELLPRIKVQVATHPNTVEWKMYQLVIYDALKQHEDAINTAKAITDIDSDPHYDYVLSCAYENFGDYTSALNCAQQAFESDSTYYKYASHIINIQLALNLLPQAVQTSQFLVSEHPEFEGSYAFLAGTYFEMQDYKKAVEEYSTAIALNSSYHYARFKRGYAYLLSGDTTKANKDFRYLVNNAEGEIERVFALIHLGELDQARELTDKMYNNDSILQEERYNISCSYALLGETELAFTLLEDMLKDGYTDYNHLRRDVDFTPIQGERFDSLINHYDALTQERIRAYHGDVTDTIQQERVVEVPFTAANGVTKVDCTINKLPLKFVFDTGASDVTISQVEANFMIKNGYLSEKDIIGKQHYQTADGDISVGTTILLKEVQFAGLILRDVRASVVQSQQAPLLLGQSVLKRLGKIEIDNANRVLKITTNQ